jgi:D-tyrosyl-tRNA(Tyr) deacylase
MKALLQRVVAASVIVGDKMIAEIGRGMLVFLGVEKSDSKKDLDYLAGKISNLRIFDDEAGKMNLSVRDVGGEVLVVSQFTLAADCRKGNRPSLDSAESPEKAEDIYREMGKKLLNYGIRVAEGKFGAHMQVRLVNDGPVTIWLDSRQRGLAREQGLNR